MTTPICLLHQNKEQFGSAGYDAEALIWWSDITLEAQSDPYIATDWRSSTPFLKNISGCGFSRLMMSLMMNYMNSKKTGVTADGSLLVKEKIALEQDWLGYPVLTSTWVPNASAGIRGVFFSFSYASYSRPLSLLHWFLFCLATNCCILLWFNQIYCCLIPG